LRDRVDQLEENLFRCSARWIIKKRERGRLAWSWI
jgi:hypothetical protein